LNHFNVDSVMKATIEKEGIEAKRHTISPSIFNNILWAGTVQEGDEIYHFSRYSLFDRERAFEPFKSVPGQHDLLANHQNTRELRILNWFTKGYIGYMPLDSGRIQVNDLRYGLFGDDPENPNHYIFTWVVDTTTTPITILQRAGPSEDVDPGEMLGNLWERLKGI
ncbi:MAG: hypothetical protein AAFQ37_14075, partial [Bacteroidota bacterium]